MFVVLSATEWLTNTVLDNNGGHRGINCICHDDQFIVDLMLGFVDDEQNNEIFT